MRYVIARPFKRLQRRGQVFPLHQYVVRVVGGHREQADAIGCEYAGKLLVDGAKMAADTYKGVGWCIGFLAGWVLEKRQIGFSTDVPMMTRITRLVTGLFGYYAVSLILITLLKKWIPGPSGTVLTCFLQMFYVSYIFPWCTKLAEKQSCVDLSCFRG